MSATDIIKVVSAYLNGHTIEAKIIGGKTWIETPSPAWDFSSLEYRIKQSKKNQRRSVWIHIYKDGFIGSAWPSYELCKAGAPKTGTIVKFTEEIDE